MDVFCKKKMPMNKNSTQLISFNSIETGDIDLFEDAFGLDSVFIDIIGFLGKTRPVMPDNYLTEKLIDKIRKIH